VLQVEPVTLAMPLQQLLGRPGVRVACLRCGEEVLNDRALPTAAGPVCAGCATRPYYSPVGSPPEADSEREPPKANVP
jgi:formylmethanofuran dehydrogenase subunit E